MARDISEKISTAIGIIVVVLIAGWGVTYVPVLSDTVPSIMTAPEPTVTADMADFSVNDLRANRVPSHYLEDACKKIPFLLRPVASKPTTARIRFEADGIPLGTATYSCRDGDLLKTTYTQFGRDYLAP